MAVIPVQPEPAASVLVLRPASKGFEVLMVHRQDRGVFGGIVVFPGGKVDLVDRSDLSRSAVSGDFDDQADRAAALRELAEETGLAGTTNGVVAAPNARDEAMFSQIESRGEVLDAEALVLVSRWVTPESSPRRFDTRFYLLASADPPTVRLDKTELVNYDWVTPGEALRRSKSGEWPMILPTIAHLRWLSRRASIDDAMDSARGADGRTLIEPKRVEDGSILPILLPEDVS